jgi:hypothetical protein
VLPLARQAERRSRSPTCPRRPSWARQMPQTSKKGRGSARRGSISARRSGLKTSLTQRSRILTLLLWPRNSVQTEVSRRRCLRLLPHYRICRLPWPGPQGRIRVTGLNLLHSHQSGRLIVLVTQSIRVVSFLGHHDCGQSSGRPVLPVLDSGAATRRIVLVLDLGLLVCYLVQIVTTGRNLVRQVFHLVCPSRVPRLASTISRAHRANTLHRTLAAQRIARVCLVGASRAKWTGPARGAGHGRTRLTFKAPNRAVLDSRAWSTWVARAACLLRVISTHGTRSMCVKRLWSRRTARRLFNTYVPTPC